VPCTRLVTRTMSSRTVGAARHRNLPSASKDRCVRRKKPSAGRSLPGELRDHSRGEQSRVALAFLCEFEYPFRSKGGRRFTIREMECATDFFERTPHGRDRVGFKDEEPWRDIGLPPGNQHVQFFGRSEAASGSTQAALSR
jgi:hypothetical protein